ncbi:hypothetical protein [Sphingobium aquiterrae]|uniref:hypothetical protein n=1 Tax=Sphingobium aquiterrae TaxID=2038656 RepID=UPI0030183C01
MAEPKPFSSLTSGLLARKGGAKPAMRRQVFGGLAGDLSAMHGQDDLGWNDMGEEDTHYSDPMAVVGLTPMPHAAQPIPQVVEQRRALEQRVSAPVIAPVIASSVAAPPVAVEPVAAEPAPHVAVEVILPVEAAPAPVARVRAPVAKGILRKAKAAFTLRLDPARHLRLRLACAVGNRSAQQIVTQALDEYLERQPDIEALASHVPGEGAQ